MGDVHRFLDELRKQRLLFVQGLDANKDDINLDIFEDFYPDKAHCVYELLQNAEDAGATEISFSLKPDRLVCEHNGSRTFTEADVKSITGIHNSTKAKLQDKIGKFGVGFKSVFVYTQSPAIRSGDYAFRIEQKVVPVTIDPDSSLGNHTRFEFPFDNPKKPPKDAYAEIAAGLNELDETCLLFLPNLHSIAWKTDKGASGEVLRNRHSDFHFEILKQSEGETTARFHLLKFDDALCEDDKQHVAVAFPLDFLPGVRQFEYNRPLAEQLRIIPASPGRVAVFFTAAKEASGLRFHLHGPFVPELSRASIKDTDVNKPLFEQLAQLAARALHHVRDLGLLTPDFLSVLPNPQDQLPPRYQAIRDAIVAEMREHPLTPTQDRGHAAAKRLVQARAPLKELLSAADIEFLVEHDGDAPLWAIGAVRNSRIDHFLGGLGIPDWDLDEFVKTLRSNASEDLFGDLNEDYLTWLAQKPPEWLQRLYTLLHTELSQTLYRVKEVRLVRLHDGTLTVAARAFFPNDHAGTDLPIVDAAVYASGRSEQQQKSAKEFLTRLGVREFHEAEQVELILKQRYTKEAAIPDDATYARDLRRFVTLTEKQPDKASLFSEYYIFQGDDGDWLTPGQIYLDQPYLDTGVAAYYGRITARTARRALHARYADSGIPFERLGKFAEAVGACTRLEIRESTCEGNPQWNELIAVSGNWTSSSINRDYHIPYLADLLKTPSLALSRLIWRTLSSLPSWPNHLQATYQRNRSHGARYALSRLIHDLKNAAWIPQGGDTFVRPTDAAIELLPEGFSYDPGYKWLKEVRFGETIARQSAEARQKDDLAKSLGFQDAQEIEQARRIKSAFDALPPLEQRRILAALNTPDKSALPDRELANPQRRAQNVREQALKAPDKETEIRERSVSIGREDVKEVADRYLREHYRNADGEMTCQICKGPLPFKLDDGREFFETVEFLPELTKRHHQNYLALCPTHSAMYRHVNGSRDTMRVAFEALRSNELDVVLAQQDFTIYFSRTHILDLGAILEAERSLSAKSEQAKDASPVNVS